MPISAALVSVILASLAAAQSPPGGRGEFRRRAMPFVGVQYLRPPNPPPEDFDRDLALMHKTGLRVAKVWVYWATVNPAPGAWVWDVYDRFFDAAGRQGLRVLLQLMPDAAPYWFEARHPETRYVAANGAPVELAARSSAQVGGTPGLCVHNAAARLAVEEFIRRTVERYRSRESLEFYDVWNEIWLTECYCPATQKRFQDYLRRKYRNIEALNRAYGGSSYTAFTQVTIPRRGVFANQFDYAEFWREVKNEHMRWRVAAVSAHDRNHALVSHFHTYHPLSWEFDAWDLAEPVDKWGASVYLGDIRGGLRLTSQDLHRISMQMNVIRDSAAGKPWWLAEHTSGPVWGGFGSTQRTPAEVLLKTMLAFSFGAEASLYWQWRPENFGQEAPHFGLTGYAGEPTGRTEAAGRICRMLDTHKAVFQGMTWARPQVGLLWDPVAASFARYAPDETGIRNFEGYFDALLELGYDVEILHARRVAASGVPRNLKVIFAPCQNFERAGLAERLAAWVRSGGALIAGPMFLLFSEATYLNRVVPPPPMAEVFGARHDDVHYPEKPLVGAIAGQKLVETYETAGAEVLGRWEEKPALTVNRHGRGHAVLCGSFFGAAKDAASSRDFRGFVDRMCRLGGAGQEAEVAGGCILRMARSGRLSVAFVLNFSDRAVTCEISGPAVSVWSAQDLLSGTRLERTAGRPFSLTLGPKGSSLLLLDGKR